MKTIVAGSRDATLAATIAAIESCPWTITEVISGGARGADTHGEYWAAQHVVPVRRMPADWTKGRGAGLARNVDMANIAEALVAAWDGKSPGTKHMINTARKMGLKVHVYTMIQLVGDVTENEWVLAGKPEQWPCETARHCAVCGLTQYMTPNGITCVNGHGGADGVPQETTLSQLQQFADLVACIPGEVATWVDLSRRMQALKLVTDPMYKGSDRDHTVSDDMWGHLRNLTNATRNFAFALSAFDRGDDPDIPF